MATPSRRRWLGSLLGLVAMVTLGACTGGATAATPPAFGFTVVAAADRKAAPTVAAELLDGSGTYALGDHAGDVVVINFWASWCGPCVSEAPDLEQAYQDTKGDKVTFLGVNTRGDDHDAAVQFIRNHKPSYPNVFDPAGKVALEFAWLPIGVPATIVLDRHGRVAAYALGTVIQSTLEPVVAQVAGEPS